MTNLLAESGYVEHRGEITEDLLQDYLESHPQLISAWQSCSEDQRCTPSWFLRETTIGQITTLGNIESEKTFQTDSEACAAYIKIMMEQFNK